MESALRRRAEGLIPCGLGARDTLRLEASMPLYGHEMNDEITPKMAGLPCKLTGKDFIGRDALVALGAPKMKRIGMKVVGRGIVREHCDLYTMDGEKIGWASSGTFAPYIGCGVAMGYIPVEDIEIGKHLNADVRGRMVELEIVPMPFYSSNAETEIFDRIFGNHLAVNNNQHSLKTILRRKLP